VVAAGFCAGVGVLFFIGALAPFNRFVFEVGPSLGEVNGALLFAVILGGMVCVGACIGELLGLREALLAGAGLATPLGVYAAVMVVSLGFGDGASPWIGSFVWSLVAIGGIVVGILLLIDVVKRSDATRSPTVFAACSLGGGITMTVALLVPQDQIGTHAALDLDRPFVAILAILYAAVPTLAGVAAMVLRSRAAHIVGFGVTAWYTLEWAQHGIFVRNLFGDILGGQFFLMAVGLLVLGVSAVGGGLVRWRGTRVAFDSPRDYALPISAVSVFLIVFLIGLVG
jgi:hypothetical protein